MRSPLRQMLVLGIGLAALASIAGCNPTWTKDGKPNDSSMPLPPDASTPKQAGAADAGASTPAQKP